MSAAEAAPPAPPADSAPQPVEEAAASNSSENQPDPAPKEVPAPAPVPAKVYHGYENLFAEFGLLEDQERLFQELPKPPGASDAPTFYHLVQDQPGAAWLINDAPDFAVNPFLKSVRQHSQVGHLVTFEAPPRLHLRPLDEYRNVLDFGLRTGSLGLLGRSEELVRQAQRQG